MALTEMFLSLASNPYFSAGFGLFGVGSAAAMGRAVAKVSVAAFKRNYITTLQVHITLVTSQTLENLHNVSRFHAMTRPTPGCCPGYLERPRRGHSTCHSGLEACDWSVNRHLPPDCVTTSTRRPMTGQSGRRRREGW